MDVKPLPGLEPVAKMLDRLSVEIREAATLLRMAAGPSVRS